MAGLYLHIPFCRSKCAYCDFFSSPRTGELDPYARSLVKELRLRKNELGMEPVKTVYLGGGTPSMLPPATLASLVEGVRREVSLDSVEEFTIEANPEDVTPAFLELARSLGINRVSIGVQSFFDDELQAVNRKHSSGESLRALETLAESGFNFNADLIYGLPGQTLQRWEENLRMMLAFRPPHLSAYLLSYEPGTLLYARLMNGKVKETSESEASEMYGALCAMTSANGYRHYEISNLSLPGMESRHNSSYWDYTPYLGLGCAAHSFDGANRRYNPLDIKRYIDALSRGETVCEMEEETADNRFNDYVVTALRTDRGLSPAFVEKEWGTDRRKWLDGAAAPLVRGGMLDLSTDGNLVIPEKRWLTSDAVMRELIFV